MRDSRTVGSKIRNWLAIWSVLSLLAFAGAPAVVAQTPEAEGATPAADSPAPEITPLFVADFAELPSAPVTIRLLRITLQPGASVPEHTHPGPEFQLVESGTLTATPVGDAEVARSGGGDSETVSETVELSAGDWILFPAGTGMTFSNATDEEVVILSAVIQPVGDGAPASIDYADDALDGDTEARKTAYIGVDYVVLGDGLLRTLPEGAATVAVNQVTLAAGTAFPASESPVLVSRIDGNLSFTVESGQVQVTRSAQEALAPNSPPGETYTLGTGDAAFFPNGVESSDRADEGEAVSYYTLSILTEVAPSGDAARVVWSDPVDIPDVVETPEAEDDGTDSQDGDEGDEPSGDDSLIGSTVYALDDNVNVRIEPSVDAEVSEQLATGVELTVLDGPVEADDYVWYEVEIVSSGETGWVVDEFIGDESELPEDSETDATPAAEETEEAEATEEDVEGTPAATQEYAEGDVVVVNDDGLRIRTDPSTDSEVLDTLDEGTVLTILDGPEEAEDYIWYEVESEDGELSGWVVVDFLDPQDLED